MPAACRLRQRARARRRSHSHRSHGYECWGPRHRSQMRLLMIDDDARFGALILHHASCRWPDARVDVHSPRVQGAVSPEFRAQGFDAVLVAGSGADGCGLEWLTDVAGRPGFAPLIFLSREPSKAAARKARHLGAEWVLNREDIEHRKLIAVLGAAAEKQAIARA